MGRRKRDPRGSPPAAPRQDQDRNQGGRGTPDRSGPPRRPQGGQNDSASQNRNEQDRAEQNR